MKFPQEFIERVQEANDLVDLISQYTQLKATGRNLMGRCPFPDHQEKTASFSVSSEKQVYHCFGCKKSGSIFTFLQDYNGMSFPEAIEYLANRASIPLPRIEQEDRAYVDQVQLKKKQMYKVNELASFYFYENLKRLPLTHPVHQYIQKRGLTAETLTTFKIGFSSEDWDGLVQFLASKNIPGTLLEEAGLAKARTGGKSGHYDLFRGRLMFPIFSLMGEAVGFGGRVIDANQSPKYLNSPETPVFNKSKTMYGLSETARHIRSEDQALIVEGYMDLVSLYQAGIQNVAATLGTALTLDHGKLLKRMTKNIVVLFDGDSAGQNAAERSLPILLQAGVYPKALILPNNLDPDDFVKANGAEALRALIAQAEDLFSVILTKWLESYRGSASEKIKIADLLKPVFAAIEDQRLWQLYLKEASQKMRVDEKWLKDALANVKKPNTNQVNVGAASEGVEKNIATQTASISEQKIVISNAPKAELMLLGLTLKNRAYLDKVTQQEAVNFLTHKGLRSILLRIQELSRQEPEKFDKLPSLLTSKLDKPELILSALTVSNDEEGTDSERENKLLADCIKKVRDQFLRQQAQSLANELKSNPSPEKLEQFMNIQKNRLSLKKPDVDKT